MNLDESLRQALRREPPPPGFRDRVLQGLASAPRRRTAPRWRAAAAVLLVMGSIGSWTVHRIQRQREGERARGQVMLALRIAGQKVHYAREEVRQTLKGTTR